jgi:hypothetical protein
MALLHTLTENLAATMLARDGIEVIWRLHLAATAAHRNGYARSAASILEIADAAEEVCRRATIDTDEPGSSVLATT